MKKCLEYIQKSTTLKELQIIKDKIEKIVNDEIDERKETDDKMEIREHDKIIIDKEDRVGIVDSEATNLTPLTVKHFFYSTNIFTLTK